MTPSPIAVLGLLATLAGGSMIDGRTDEDDAFATKIEALAGGSMIDGRADEDDAFATKIEAHLKKLEYQVAEERKERAKSEAYLKKLEHQMAEERKERADERKVLYDRLADLEARVMRHDTERP